MKYAIGYKQARADFEELETIAELSDQIELDAQRLDLMRNPTKSQAARMYCTAIYFWFREHGTMVVERENHRAAEIGNRYGLNILIA